MDEFFMQALGVATALIALGIFIFLAYWGASLLERAATSRSPEPVEIPAQTVWTSTTTTTKKEKTNDAEGQEEAGTV